MKGNHGMRQSGATNFREHYSSRLILGFVALVALFGMHVLTVSVGNCHATAITDHHQSGTTNYTVSAALDASNSIFNTPADGVDISAASDDLGTNSSHVALCFALITSLVIVFGLRFLSHISWKPLREYWSVSFDQLHFPSCSRFLRLAVLRL